MEVVENFQIHRRFWAVGAYFDDKKIDRSNDFFIQNIWYDGWAKNADDLRDIQHLNSVQMNDVFILKSKATKNKNQPFTRLKAIGIVIKRENMSTFNVKWYKGLKFPIDFDGILYMKTIEEMRNDELLEFVKAFLIKLKL